MKTRGVDATLAAIATLTAAWPISTLLADPSWVFGTLLLLAVVVLSGMSARSLALRGWQVLTAQLVCVVLTAAAIYGRGHLWHGLPTFETLGFANRLVSEALASAEAYAAPAPTTPGLSFVVGGALALVALSVDYLAVTRRSPSLAGLPLLTAFLASAANSGSSLPVRFFLVAAVMWLLLVARAGSASLRRWASTVAVPRTPVRGTIDSQGVIRSASIARSLGAVALVAAVIMPVVLPHLPPKFLLSGLGRNDSSKDKGQGSNVSGTVGFSLKVDLAENLRDPSTAPVLKYTTADTAPPPLRVAIGSLYRSVPGVWLPWGRPVPDVSKSPSVPEPAGLQPDVPKTRFTTTFTHNLLDEPNLAVPYPLIAADLHGVAWGADNQSQRVRVAQRPDSYTASYWRLDPPATMLRSTPPLSETNRTLFDMDLRVDGPSSGPVTTLSERLTAGKTSDYDRAMAIQQYLRADGGFTYSLTLAPRAKDRFGKDAGYDPLTNFLVTKRGYCVQFATAMVMMSRAADIPARLAIGFLPGTRAGGVWTVTRSDAHAWPELYLDGIGWTRFEPTPSRATPPVYALAATAVRTPAGGQPTEGAKGAVRPTSSPKDLGDTSTGGSTLTDGGATPTSGLMWLTRGPGLVVFGLLLILFGSLVVPTASFWRRRRNRAAARTAAERVEVQWELLTSSLDDLGITPAPSRTPRQLRAYYVRQAHLDGDASEALRRVVHTLERSRYAAPGPDADGLADGALASDARQVVRAAAANRRRRERIRAALWPSAGLAEIRTARDEAAWRFSAPLRKVSNAVRQWFTRHKVGISKS